MKIVQLLSGMNTAITNEENEFIDKHDQYIQIDSLTERDHWIAQNLVRKGIYSISKDNNTLNRTKND